MKTQLWQKAEIMTVKLSNRKFYYYYYDKHYKYHCHKYEAKSWNDEIKNNYHIKSHHYEIKSHYYVQKANIMRY